VGRLAFLCSTAKPSKARSGKLDTPADGAWSSSAPFDSVLSLGFPDSLPLHVPRIVDAAFAKRNDVIHHIARATMRVAAQDLEFVLGPRAPLDPPVRVSGHPGGVALRVARRCRARVRSMLGGEVFWSCWVARTGRGSGCSAQHQGCYQR